MSLLTSVIGVIEHAYNPSAWEPKAGAHMFEASQGYTARICQTKQNKISSNKYFFFKGRKDKRNRRKGILSKANR